MPSAQKLVPTPPSAPQSDSALPTVSATAETQAVEESAAAASLSAAPSSVPSTPKRVKDRKEKQEELGRERMSRLREDVSKLRKQLIIPFCIVFVIGTLTIIGFAVTPLAFSDPKFTDFIRMEQVSLAALIGYVVTFLGVLVSWMGVETSYRVAGRGRGYSLAIAATSPGVLLIFGGCVIVGVCVLKPYTHSQTTETTPGGNTITGRTITATQTAHVLTTFGRTDSVTKEFLTRSAQRLETNDESKLASTAKELVAEADHYRNLLEAIKVDLGKADTKVPPDFERVLKFYEKASSPPMEYNREQIREWFRGIKDSLKDLPESKQ